MGTSRFLTGLLVILALIGVCTFLVWNVVKTKTDTSGLLPAYPGPQPKTLQGFLRLFETSGVLIHMLSPLWIQTFLSEGRPNFTLDTDCDPDHSCAAYTFWQQALPLSVVSFKSTCFQFGLCYDAAALWPEVMCTSVFDANTSNRNCCTCAYAQDCVDPRLCAAKACSPGSHSPSFSSPYCHRPLCGKDRECRALNAGCGPNLWSLKYSGECEPDKVLAGSCAACKKPQWCNGEGVDSAAAWLQRFLKHGGHGNQCRFLPEEQDLWYQTMLDFYAAVQDHGMPPDFVSLENEVNFYLNDQESDYGDTHQRFMGAMMAIIYLPNNLAPGQELPPDLLGNLRSLREHLRPLLGDVPLLQLNVEQPLSLLHWRRDQPAQLLGGFYNLTEIS